MWRPSNRRPSERGSGGPGWSRAARSLVASAVCGLAASAAPAQAPDAARQAQRESAAAIEAYLDRPGLRPLLAEHLAARLKAASPEERALIGERLGKLYVEFIGAAKKPADRQMWEEKARDLLRVVPEVKSYALRLDLTRTSYVKAEEAAERWRLRLGTDEDKADAERTLRTLKSQFEAIGTEVNHRLETLERAEESGRAPDKISDEIGEARRLRSIAYYYAGWSSYYLALLSGSDSPAIESLKSFGWVLGAGQGRSATLERLPKNLLKYDHVSRAAIGCALASALRRDGDTEGLRWLDAVEGEAAVPAEIKSQLLTRRITILGAARRWADLEARVRYARNADRDGKGPAVTPLETLAARLLAVVCFEADRKTTGEVIEQLGQIAMSDLVARGEVGHVLDLAQRYGTGPLGDVGFIVHYVRGMQAYERAVKAHKDSGANVDEPTREAALMNQYRQAAALLDSAPQQDDAPRFPGERGRAIVAAGRALFKAGDFVPAAERFAQAATLIPEKPGAEEALWLAIISLDRVAAESTPPPPVVAGRLEELTTLFLRTYPQTERAASLLVRRAAQGGVDDEQAASILLGVDSKSPVYLSARRQAARILYRMFRGSNDSSRGFAAARFVKIAEELLSVDKKIALESARTEATEATERLVLLTRQVLDALLTSATPDVQRAEAVLDMLRSAVTFNNFDTAGVDSELRFRRLQILVAREDNAGAEALADELRAAGGRFADAADRLLYQRAVARWKKAAQDPAAVAGGAPRDPAAQLAAAASVVKLGTRVLDRMGSGPGALQDNAVLTVYRQVAQAASEIWAATKDVASRDLAIKLDKAVINAAPGNIDSLHRLAGLAEDAGDPGLALECWRTLASGHKPNTPEWFAAKYNLARLLAEQDAPKALDVLSQVQVLYPEFGAEPWRSKLKALFEKLKAGGGSPAPAPASTPGPAPAQGPAPAGPTPPAAPTPGGTAPAGGRP